MQIEQIDRDAAADFFAVAGWHGKGGSIRRGLRDDETLVQAFAAHRLAAIKSAAMDGLIASSADEYDFCPDDSAVERVAFAIIEGSAGSRAAEHAREFQTANWTDALRSARAAIRAMHHE